MSGVRRRLRSVGTAVCAAVSSSSCVCVGARAHAIAVRCRAAERTGWRWNDVFSPEAARRHEQSGGERIVLGELLRYHGRPLVLLSNAPQVHSARPAAGQLVHGEPPQQQVPVFGGSEVEACRGFVNDLDDDGGPI